MGECRNCGSITLEELGFIGDVAPFFLARVLRVQGGFSPGAKPTTRVFRRFTGVFRHLLVKLYRPTVMVELQICSACSFLQTKYPFSDAALKNLYEDYRSDSYNEERTRYEPSYASVAKDIGVNEHEVRNRVADLTAWLASKIEPGHRLSMLDYGGADGRFLPHLAGNKYVFEVSSIAPASGVIRIDSETALSTYS